MQYATIDESSENKTQRQSLMQTFYLIKLKLSPLLRPLNPASLRQVLRLLVSFPLPFPTPLEFIFSWKILPVLLDLSRLNSFSLGGGGENDESDEEAEHAFEETDSDVGSWAGGGRGGRGRSE